MKWRNSTLLLAFWLIALTVWHAMDNARLSRLAYLMTIRNERRDWQSGARVIRRVTTN